MDSMPASITKTLGMRWNVAHDILFYVFPSTPVKTTRRSMLSKANSSIFDPLGLLSPWLIHVKALLQEVTKSKVGWDEPVPRGWPPSGKGGLAHYAIWISTSPDASY